MAISTSDFLQKYFGVPELQDALGDLMESTTGNKNELVKRLTTEWAKYRDVYNLLDFLDEDQLLVICYHFYIEFGSTSHGALKNRIKKAEILGSQKSKNILNDKTKQKKLKLLWYHTNEGTINWSKLGTIIGIIAVSLTIIGIILSQPQ